MNVASSETERLAALDRYSILDTPPEPCLDRISRLAAQFFATPMAVISFVTQDRSWFKSRYGFDRLSQTELVREASFCAHTILGRGALVIPDAAADERFAGLATVAGPPGIRFYAGAPLVTPEGFAVGTLAVMDTRPRGSLSPAQSAALRDFGALVQEELNRRSSVPVPREESLQRMVDALPALAWMCDPEGRATFLSRYWFEFSGRGLDSGLEQDWVDLIHPEDREYVRARVRAAIAAKADTAFEFRVRRADGEYRWVLDQACPQFRHDGSFSGYVGICIDITERKRTEETSARLAAIVRSSEQAIMSIGGDDNFQTWNPAAERLFGYSADDVLGGSVLRIVPPDRTAELAANLARIRRGESVPHYETVRIRKDGTPVRVSLSLSAIRDPDGTPIAVSAIATDLTSLKQAEAARRESEEWLKMAQDAAGIGIWDWSLPEGTCAGSDRYFRLYGLLPRDSAMTYAEWLSLVHPGDRERIQAYYGKVWRETDQVESEYRVVWPDGSVHWLVSKARPATCDPAGAAVRVVGINLEVTRLKQAEQARLEAEERYAHLFRTMAQGVIYFDDECRVLSANASAERILGMTSDELRERYRSNLHWSTTREDDNPLPVEASPALIALRTGAESHNLVVDVANLRTGAKHWVSIDTFPQCRPGHTRPYQVYSIFQDITDRVEAQAHLRASEERFRLVIEHGLEVIDILDVDATIRYASPSVERVFGYPVDSLVGTNGLEYIHSDERAVVQEALESLLSSPGGTASVQFRMRHHDGTWRYAEGTATNCLHIQGLRGIVVNLRDITAQKRFEEDLLTSRQQLRQLARRIEAAREEERIRISREIHDELGQVLSVLKHDIESLPKKYRLEDTEMRRVFTRKIQTMRRTIKLTIDTVRRISAELRPGILDHLGLSAALRWQVDEFALRTGIRCRCRGFAKDLHLAAGQATAVFRIFQEVLTNILRHAEASAIAVDLHGTSGWLTLRMADNGKGIAPEHLSDPHSLGLLGMRERALLFGGEVRFSARRGGGTVVTVRMPAQAPVDAEPQPSQDRDSALPLSRRPVCSWLTTMKPSATA